MDLWQSIAMFLAGMCIGALVFFVWAWRAMGDGE